jgi:hypothetical protein
MGKVIIWDSEGRILHTCDSDDEAADIIQDCGYTELCTTFNGRDKNICVAQF